MAASLKTPPNHNHNIDILAHLKSGNIYASNTNPHLTPLILLIF